MDNGECVLEMFFVALKSQALEIKGQVSVWQSVTELLINCTSLRPVPAWVEEPVSPVRRSSGDGAMNNSPFLKVPKASMGK